MTARTQAERIAEAQTLVDGLAKYGNPKGRGASQPQNILCWEASCALADALALIAEKDAALRRTLDSIAELNKTEPDENGVRWDVSDLIGQEIIAARISLGR